MRGEKEMKKGKLGRERKGEKQETEKNERGRSVKGEE